MSFRTNLQYLRAQRNMTQERLAMLLGVSRQAISKWESEKAYPEMDKLLMICDLFGCTLDDLVLGDVSVSTSRPDSHGRIGNRLRHDCRSRTGEDAGSLHMRGTRREVSATPTSRASRCGRCHRAKPHGRCRPARHRDGTGSPRPAVHANTATLPQDLTGYDEHRRRFIENLFAVLEAGGYDTFGELTSHWTQSLPVMLAAVRGIDAEDRDVMADVLKGFAATAAASVIATKQ